MDGERIPKAGSVIIFLIILFIIVIVGLNLLPIVTSLVPSAYGTWMFGFMVLAVVCLIYFGYKKATSDD
jgi:hypothetical protein